jgi:DNA-binding winged helix-turn-helix (wHTH) protein
MSDDSNHEECERLPFRLGEWTVEPMLDRITRDGETIQLRPRAMDVLVCLAVSTKPVVSKQHLIDHVWHTEFVTDNALTHVIAELRTALGDDAKCPSYIETIPRRGYRLVTQVTLETATPPPSASVPARFKLEAEDGTEIPLEDGENLIGRSPDATIFIDTSEVSRRHARIVVADDAVTIEDLGSKNGTFVRGKRLDRPISLENADEIQIGVAVAKLRFKALDDRTRTEEISEP